MTEHNKVTEFKYNAMNMIDIPRKYLVKQERWDILSKAFQILLRRENIKNVPAGKLDIKIELNKWDKLDIWAMERID